MDLHYDTHYLGDNFDNNSKQIVVSELGDMEIVKNYEKSLEADSKGNLDKTLKTSNESKPNPGQSLVKSGNISGS